MGIGYKYDAFISYRHVSPDKEIAEKLQKKLENYRPPKALRNVKKRGGWRIFRDETELPTSSDLSNDIKAALEESQFLIVICSKTTKDSRWCLEEIEYFKELHNGNNANIITLVADGKPEDVFPPLLCNELIPVTDEHGNTTYQNHIIEPLAANVAGKTLKESLKKLNTEYLRIAAPILGCGYDNLYNREQKRKVRRIFVIGTAVVVSVLLFALYSSAMVLKINSQKEELQLANADLQRKTAELDLSNKTLQETNARLSQKTEEAENNLIEANKQKESAEKNLAEARLQKKLAEENLREANRQKKIAEDNLAEANRQQKIAESNFKEAENQRLIAQANEARANEANRDLKIKNSEILASQSQIYLENDDVYSAIKTAIEALPGDEDDLPPNPLAEKVLAEAAGAYSPDGRMLCRTVNLAGYVEFMEFSADGTGIFACDANGIVYVIDFAQNKVLKTYSPFETFGQTSDYITDICVDGNTGYVLCREQVISVNLSDGSLNWHYNKDHDSYTYADEIITDVNSDIVVISGGSQPVVIRKSDGTVVNVGNYNSSFEYGSWDEYNYMDAEGRLYTVNSESKSMAVNDFANSIENIVSVLADDDFKVLSMGENEDCIFVNLIIGNEYSSNQAKLICYDKSDMSAKWSTDYTAEYLGRHHLNRIFEFKHRLPDDTGEYHNITGVVVISGVNILAFDKETGELYFCYAAEYEDELLYCKPNENEYSLTIARSDELYPRCLLINPASGLSSEDTLFLNGGYTFDKNRKYVTCSQNGNYALASENSPEINMYYKASFNAHTMLDDFPNISYSIITDNGKGVIAAACSELADDVSHNYIVMFDVNVNQLLAKKKVDIDVKKMSFVGDKLFATDNYGKSVVLHDDGSLHSTADLTELIKKSAGVEDDTYISAYNPYLKPVKDGVIYCIPYGMFKVDLSGETQKVSKFIWNGNLGNFCISEDFASFVDRSYENDKIAYFKDGDSQFSYVTETGEIAEFVHDSISSVINSDDGYTIAFISKDGYIGVYKYGDEGISKITLNLGETTPLKILFTPDSDYLIAMCSNGKFIKYSLETFEEVAEYASGLKIDAYSEYEFVDNNTFIVQKSTYSNEAILVDSDSMKLKAEIKNYVYFMKEDKKILFSTYINGKKKYGYYVYKTGSELVKFAEEFLSGK